MNRHYHQQQADFQKEAEQTDRLVEVILEELHTRGSLDDADEAAFRKGLIAGKVAGRVSGRRALANELHAMLYPEQHPEGDPYHDPDHVFWDSGTELDAFEWSADTIEWVGERVDRERS